MKNRKTSEESKVTRRLITGLIALFCCSAIFEIASIASHTNRPEAQEVQEEIQCNDDSAPETYVIITSPESTTYTTETTSTTFTKMQQTTTNTQTTVTETETTSSVETTAQYEESITQHMPEVIIHTELIPIVQAAPIKELATSSILETTIDETTQTTETMTEITTEITTENTTEATTETTAESMTMDETCLGNFRITGYVATGCKTASGTWPEAGRTVAMNATQRKNLGISYGDKIRIEGLGEYIVEDSGCKSGVIDVFCNSVSECYELTPYADVYLVK